MSKPDVKARALVENFGYTLLRSLKSGISGLFPCQVARHSDKCPKNYRCWKQTVQNFIFSAALRLKAVPPRVPFLSVQYSVDIL
jgi:hypothetical protein